VAQAQVSPRHGASASAMERGSYGGLSTEPGAVTLQIYSFTSAVAVLGAVCVLGLFLFSHMLGNGEAGAAAELPVVSVVLHAGTGMHDAHGDQDWCAYGSLPGMWTTAQPGSKQDRPGNRWRLFDRRCQIQDLLSAYAGASTSEVPPPRAGAGGPDPPLTVLDTTSKGGIGGEGPTEEKGPAGQQPARILFISDSVDRHVMTYLCEYAGGRMRGVVLKESVAGFLHQQQLMQQAGGGASGSIAGAGVGTAAAGSEEEEEEEEEERWAPNRQLLLQHQSGGSGAGFTSSDVTDGGPGNTGFRGDQAGAQTSNGRQLRQQQQRHRQQGRRRQHRSAAAGLGEGRAGEGPAAGGIEALRPRRLGAGDSSRGGGAGLAGLAGAAAAAAAQERGLGSAELSLPQVRKEEEGLYSPLGGEKRPIQHFFLLDSRREALSGSASVLALTRWQPSFFLSRKHSHTLSHTLTYTLTHTHTHTHTHTNGTTQVSAANASGFVVNTCTGASGGLRLVASYIPGVHPTGPYHKQRTLSYVQRIQVCGRGCVCV
jgi:hypothetical protein